MNKKYTLTQLIKDVVFNCNFTYKYGKTQKVWKSVNRVFCQKDVACKYITISTFSKDNYFTIRIWQKKET